MGFLYMYPSVVMFVCPCIKWLERLGVLPVFHFVTATYLLQQLLLFGVQLRLAAATNPAKLGSI